jgi:hypothetical protein
VVGEDREARSDDKQHEVKDRFRKCCQCNHTGNPSGVPAGNSDKLNRRPSRDLARGRTVRASRTRQMSSEYTVTGMAHFRWGGWGC